MSSDPGRKLLATIVALLCALGPVACGDDGVADRPGSPGEGAGTATTSTIAESFELPFGLAQPEGVVPIGRPAVFERVLVVRDGVPISGTSLRAAYRVTDEDPLGVVRDWVGRIDGLTLDRIWVSSAAGSGAGPVERQPWIQARGSFEADSVDLQLWVTGDVPILLVSVDRGNASPPRRPTVTDEAGRPPAPRSAVSDERRTEGDELFEEQGDVMHLPRGTWTLMPTLPTFGGTGGSTSVIAAEDADAAVQALLDEAGGAAIGPDVTEKDGNRIIHATFEGGAGGWGFDVVAVRAPQDPYATVYVVSHAD